MSPSRAQVAGSDVEPELDRIADELYRLRPEDFASARDEEVVNARAAGQAALAREIGRLRRPTQSAWLINLLWRDQREVMDQLLDLGAELSQAQAQASGPELRRLMAVRRELESALIRRARELGEERGVAVSASTEREAQETLAAAVAQPEVADSIRSGRLVKPAAYVGFGTLPSAPAAGVQSPARGSAAPVSIEEATQRRQKLQEERRRADEAEGRRRLDERRRAEEAERRAAAERRLAEAQASLEAATASLAQLDSQARSARQLHDQLRGRIDELREQLRALEGEALEASRQAIAAARRRDEAERSHQAARRTLHAAEHELAQLH